MSLGFTEIQVLDMAIDKFELYLEASINGELLTRKQHVIDTAAAIGGAMGDKAVKDHLDNLTP